MDERDWDATREIIENPPPDDDFSMEDWEVC